jgi:hypothetical protein
VTSTEAAPPGGFFLLRWIDGSVQPARLVDSITEAVGGAAGLVLISGSHGGRSAARFAIECRPRLVLFNDAGIGLDDAGVAGLALLGQAGIPAAAVAHTSARIGDARSTYIEGWVNRANAPAQALGATPGRPVREWLPPAG